MENPSRTGRPGTAGGLSRQRRARSNDLDDSDDAAGNERLGKQHSPPVRPSTQRATSSTPRAAAMNAGGRVPGNDPDEYERLQLEVESLRTNLRDADFAKTQTQASKQDGIEIQPVQLQRQGADMVKLERYIGQLVDDRGGVDAGVLESITKDLERSSRVKSALKQVADLKADLSLKEKQIAALRKSQTAEYTRKLAEEKEALAERVESLIAELERKHGSGSGETGRARASSITSSISSQKGRSGGPHEANEPERLRAQNLKMREELSRLRADLDLMVNREKSSKEDGGSGRVKRRDRTDGAQFYEGQAVECRDEGGGSWRPATIDSGQLKVEPLGGEGRGNRRYIYSVYFSDRGGERADDVPEHRIRELAGGEDGALEGQGSSRVTKNRDGETVIRARVFEAGDLVLVRDAGSGRSGTGKEKEWTFGEVVRRNGNGTYRVAVLGGRAEGKDFHPTMVRAQAYPAGDDHGDAKGGRDSREPSAAMTKTKTTSPEEEAEIRYAEEREELLALARDALPPPVEVDQEVIAKNGGSNVWGSGLVVSVEDDNRRCTVEFDFGDVEERLPCIFVRPRGGVDLSFDRDAARHGDAVLAQKSKRRDAGGGDDGADWFAARFERHGRGDEDRGSCYLVFAGEKTVSRVQAARVRPLYLAPRGGHHAGDEGATIPGDPPPPTKPVRAKKHQEGDIVLASIPRARRWTPALITAVKGRGRYAVEWADGVQAESLLFTHIASMDSPGRKGAFSTVRLRQRALAVGEPVLAKMPEHDYWSPGCVVKVDGGGRYDVRFTDGTTAEGLSFLFVRGLSTQESSGDASGEGARGGRVNSGVSDSKRSSSEGKEPAVGDTVYVLKRGHSPDAVSEDMHNRDLWRAGTVTAAVGGRFTVQYNGEEGKPTESRIVAARLRIRNVIRQKAVQKGDAVLALSNIPGRGWMMGAVTARGSDGKYTIAFADGTESDQVRYTRLSRQGKAGNRTWAGHICTSGGRAIRQRRFKKGELALAKHPESRKWVAVKVLEAPSSGRYDLEFLGDEIPNAVGVPFQSIRHLDLVRFASDCPNDPVGSNDGELVGEHGSRKSKTERDGARNRFTSDVSWDGDNGFEKNDDGIEGSGGDGESDRGHTGSDTDNSFGIGSEVFVLRRGKSQDASLEDQKSWRPGKIVSVRGNGTFAVEYDEAGAPTEDRIAETRLRRRHNSSNHNECDDHDGDRGREVDDRGRNDSARSGDSGGRRYHHPNHHEGEAFGEGDLVFATAGRGREETATKATVEAYLGDDMYRIRFTDGSGTQELDSQRLRHVEPTEDNNDSSRRGGGRIQIERKLVKKRKLTAGELVVARRGGSDGGGRKWQAAKVIEAVGQGSYSVLFAGDAETTRVHFADVKPLEKQATEGSGEGNAGTEPSIATNKNDKRGKTSAGFLCVTQPSFSLNTPASSARRTSPCLVLATGERGDVESNTPGWLQRRTGDSKGATEDAKDMNKWANGDNMGELEGNNRKVSSLARGEARAGTRNPAWKDGEFWLSLEGLEEPALFVALEDGKRRQQGRHVSEDALLAEACIPLPFVNG
ncbi:unnamed protein product, partial [Scytosiphon promiscuus]